MSADESSSSGGDNGGYISSPDSTPPPPTFADIDRWNYHISLKAFGESLQVASNAVFPNTTKSRYSQVSVLMLNWADEDPQLPVSHEIGALETVFRDIYHFTTERWEIPEKDSHFKLAERIMAFTRPEDDSTSQLKIVYYAGHAKFMETRTLAWTSWQNKKKARCPIVKWGAIQSFLEESPSDALILLDCCASGTVNTSEGTGVTELISACAWNETANGVGPYSLTSALVIELRRLSQRTSFSVGELYRNLFMRTQNRMPEDIPQQGIERERHPAPIHLLLSQSKEMPRSIQLSVRARTIETQKEQYSSNPITSKPLSNDPVSVETLVTEVSTTVAPEIVASPPLQHLLGSSSLEEGQKVPRLAFAVRLTDTFKPNENIRDLFVEWLRNIPVIAHEIKIEAGFDSFSTLLILSLPVSISAYLPHDPSLISLGPITSGNRVSCLDMKESTTIKSQEEKTEHDDGLIIEVPDEGYTSIHSFDGCITPRNSRHGFEPKRLRRETETNFAPIGEQRSILGQHWAIDFTSGLELFESDNNTSPGRLNTRQGEDSSDRQTAAERLSQPEPLTIAPLSPTSDPPQQQMGVKPALNLVIPDNALELSLGKHSVPHNPDIQGQEDLNIPGGSVRILPPPSPSAEVLISAGSNGPPNPFARPIPGQPNDTTAQPAEESRTFDTPVSPLPSRFYDNEFLPSPSSFYPEWNYDKAGENRLRSPLNFATPPLGTGPSFLSEDAGEEGKGKRKWDEASKGWENVEDSVEERYRSLERW